MSDLSEIARLLAAQSPELRESLRSAVDNGLDTLRKPKPIPLELWAHRHFYLSAESSQREEEWRAWPIQIGILHCVGSDRIEDFWFFKSARLGWSKILLADIAYTAEHQRRNQGIWLPTDGDRDDFVKTDLDPMLRDVKVMRKVFPKVLEKSKDNTLQQKKFLGSLLKLRGAHTAGNFPRLTLAKVRLDEIDGMEQNIGGSSGKSGKGDPGAGTPDVLAKKRLEGATWPKFVAGSTGRRRGLSHVERGYDACEVQMRFYIECPHCKVEHPLQWGGKKVRHGFKWDVEDPEGTVRHHCPHCFEPIKQADYLRLARTGAWVSRCGTYRLRHWWDDKGEPHAEWTLADGTPCLPPRRVGMHCWTAYSEQPGVTWAQILRDFLDAVKALKTGNRAPMIQWVNETKGETYEEDGEKADVNALQTRAKGSGYRMREVPAGALILGAAVDVQDDRFEITTYGEGPGEEMFAIDYQVLDANPALLSEWDRLWTALQVQYRHANGGWIGLSGVAVDTGGHFTHQAYFFVHKYQHANPDLRLYAIKGSSEDAQPIKAKSAKPMEVNAFGRVIKRGVKLWMVGTDTAKDLFYGRLKVTQPGPGYVHFAKDLPREYFEQYGNEKRVPFVVQGKQIFRWVHWRGRNEVVDGTVYVLFVFEALNVARFDTHSWERLRRKVTAGLFDETEAPANAAFPSELPDESEDAPQPPAAADAINPAPPATATTEQKPQQAAAKRKPSAPPAARSRFASEGWLSRDR